MSNVVPIRDDDEQAPNFITRVDITRMSDPDLDQMLEDIRTRRMQSFVRYEATMAELASVNEAKAREKLEKQGEQILKTLTSIDKTFEKLETQVHKLRGLRIQAGLSVI